MEFPKKQLSNNDNNGWVMGVLILSACLFFWGLVMLTEVKKINRTDLNNKIEQDTIIVQETKELALCNYVRGKEISSRLTRVYRSMCWYEAGDTVVFKMKFKVE